MIGNSLEIKQLPLLIDFVTWYEPKNIILLCCLVNPKCQVLYVCIVLCQQTNPCQPRHPVSIPSITDSWCSQHPRYRGHQISRQTLFYALYRSRHFEMPNDDLHRFNCVSSCLGLAELHRRRSQLFSHCISVPFMQPLHLCHSLSVFIEY